MEGADFDSVKLSVPQFSPASSLDINKIMAPIKAQVLKDLPGLISQVNIPPEAVTELAREILEDFMSYLDERGYFDFEKLAVSLETYFTSDTFRSIIKNWADDLDPENLTKEELLQQIDVLSDQLIKSLSAYLQNQGIPTAPFLQDAFTDYWETGRWKEFTGNVIKQQISSEELQKVVDSYIQTTLQPMAEKAISAELKKLEGQFTSSGKKLIAQAKQELTARMEKGFVSSLSHISECVSADFDKLAGAFSMRLDTQELSDLLLSFTNLGRASLVKNLNRLGYVEMSHPKSICIYPSNFKGKDAVISVLHRYNHEKEMIGDSNHTVSYTDTLGTVMGTVTRIVTIITGALIATVAVSLVVSSIMIGVITYISVLERRKEIGILRAMGASRHNISQIFNAETSITGLLSGTMGVLLGYLLLIPINFILHKLTGIQDIQACLPILYAVILVLISIVLTTLGGIIPSHNASKSDPVEALRTE